MTELSMNRRQMLATTGAGVMASGFLVPGVADARINPYADPCVKKHTDLGAGLHAVLADKNVGEITKNVALRTTACPDCGCRIAPAGLVTWY